MKNIYTARIIIICFFCFLNIYGNAQTCEWQLVNATYDGTDPDGAGPANGTVTFTLQVHTISGTIPNLDVIQTGFSYQSINATSPVGCGVISNPSNIVLSSTFSNYTLLQTEQCNVVPQATGGQTFDRIASGSVSSTGARLTLTTTWINVFTVTLFANSPVSPQGGYAIINSGSGGSPGQLPTYSISDNNGVEFPVNSLTYNTPLALSATVLPVLFTKFNAQCNNSGTVISWATAQEGNSSKFEVQRSTDGNNTWTSIATVAAAGNSASEKQYQQLDLYSGKALYRIKQTDKDGSFIYTGTEATNCSTRNITSVIYPVPAKDILNVVIKSDKAIRTQLLVYDISGKLMKKMDAQVTNGNNTFKINLSGLVAGDYILKSSDAAIELNKVFTITR